MKAFILAAGMGTRLRPATKNIPKALVEVNGMTMLEMTIERLKKEGVHEFMINIHHYGNDIIEFLKSRNNFGVSLEISDEREELLDTGGAIVKAAHFFSGTELVLVHNVDVISEVNISELINYHQQNEALATLCIRKRKSGRGLLFDEKTNLIGWTDLEKNEFKWVDQAVDKNELFAYSGIYIASPEFPSKIAFKGNFSIIDAWLKMASSVKVIGYHDKSETWFDLGTISKISMAEKHLKELSD